MTSSSTAAVLERFHQYAGTEKPDDADADSLIGFFQSFRPDGRALSGLFDGLIENPSVIEGLHDRLERLFSAAGNDRRPQGGRDAYFVVRKPAKRHPEEIESLAKGWLNELAQLARATGFGDLSDRLAAMPKLRVLEGVPPKHPKEDWQKAELLKMLQQNGPKMSACLPASDLSRIAASLAPAYYYVSCDWMLRDFLMWPLYQNAENQNKESADDPFSDYFELWRSGVKYRIFNDEQIDLYMPRS